MQGGLHLPVFFSNQGAHDVGIPQLTGQPVGRTPEFNEPRPPVQIIAPEKKRPYRRVQPSRPATPLNKPWPVCLQEAFNSTENHAMGDLNQMLYSKV
jgi:hypothetical protein